MSNDLNTTKTDEEDLLLLSLILLPYIAVAQTDDFNVTGSTSGTDYSYSDGVLTVNNGANITISMTNGATEQASDRIVVAANATATITLNGVSITGPGPDISSGAPAQSAIDVGENAHLILNLKDETSNVLTGGSGGTDLGAPGIHVPASSSLVIQGSGNLSVTGGNSTNTYGGSGIGGKPSTQQSGGACGTVIILATGNVTVTGGTSATSSAGGADIGGGLGTTDGGNGQGIRPSADGSYTVWGNLTLPDDITLPEGIILTGDGTISPETARPKPTITFTDEDLEKTYDGQSASLNSNDYTYTGGGTISFAWYSDNNGTQGDKLDNAPSDAGTYWVGVSAEATNLYQAAEEVTKQFTIKPAIVESPQTPTLEAVTYGVKLSEITLPDGWTWADGETVPTVTNTGYTAYYTVTDYTNYDWSGVEGWDSETHQVKRTLTLTVNKADPAYEEPTGLTATYGQTLEDVDLPDGWAWKDETQSVGEVGEHQFTAIFTPEDTDNYNTVEKEVTITVEKAELSDSQIKIEGDEPSFELGDEGTILTVTITGIEDENEYDNWTWSSDNTDVVTVNMLTPQEVKTRSTEDLVSTAQVMPKGIGDATITVTYEGANYKRTLSYDVSVKAKEEEPEPTPDPQPQPDPTPLYYNIQFEDVCEGVDASLSKSVVKEGNQVSVYVEVEDGYDAENLKVMFKRSLYGYWEEVEEGVQPGEYIIYNVYNDIYVKVEGVEKIEEEPTGMSDIESTKVYTQNGDLYIYTSQPQEVMIITMNGTVLRRERQEGLRSYSLPKGVYIICIGEERMKVRI